VTDDWPGKPRLKPGNRGKTIPRARTIIAERMLVRLIVMRYAKATD
jgi:hypothetical protein